MPEYSYDFPLPSSSSLMIPQTPRTSKHPHILRRPRSSSPTYLSAPLFPSHHSSKYLPSSRAAEVSRLLDPAYASSPHSAASAGGGSTSSNSPLSVFVDHYGDLHDPEYRHFPVVVNSKPKWEREHGLIDEDDEDEDDDGDDVGRPFAFGGVFPSRKPVPAFRPSYAYSSYHHYDVPYPSPSSYESNALAATVEDIDESPFGDAEEKEVKSSTRKARRHGRSHSKTKTVEEKEGLAAAEESAPEPQEKDNEWTPTCTESIRREWQAITLSLRFSVFRLKRKIKHRLATG